MNSDLPRSVLVTGGAGYIGSHTCVALLQRGCTVTIVDNFDNSSPDVLDRIARTCGTRPALVEADIRDTAAMRGAIEESHCQAVVHFAALKAVGESGSQPLRYYDNNVGGSISLLQAMRDTSCRQLVFSSSATVYGEPDTLPINEDCRLGAVNVYGRTKLMIEDILRDLARSDPAWSFAILRYFNPAGAHPGGLIGELPNGIPNNLFPYVSQVAQGQRPELSVFGDDYPTPDGTGVRDYIHVCDLAEGHLAALAWATGRSGARAFNLGTGRGYSVLEIVNAFAAASGRDIPYRICPRRDGDIAESVADPSRAERELHWRAQRGLREICEDAWRWQSGLEMPAA